MEVLFKKFVLDVERLYGIEHVRINIHFLTHLPRCVLDWGCLWATSTFIPEWFNGELISLFNGTQFVPDQMAKNHLTKLAVRNEVASLLDRNRLPKDVASLFRELLRLPDNVKHRSGMKTNDGTVYVLGKPVSRKAKVDEEVALLNLFSSKAELIPYQETDFESSVWFYDRLKLMKTSLIFTTNCYKKSPKRINYCVLLRDGSFAEIVSIPVLTLPDRDDFHAFIICQILGSHSKSTYIPRAIDDVTFRPLMGQTTKLIGRQKQLIAVTPCEILTKCVVSVNNSLTDTIVATALPNPFETD